VQTAWLWHRSRLVMRSVQARDVHREPRGFLRPLGS
jgi:hypothetical protein